MSNWSNTERFIFLKTSLSFFIVGCWVIVLFKAFWPIILIHDIIEQYGTEDDQGKGNEVEKMKDFQKLEDMKKSMLVLLSLIHI